MSMRTILPWAIALLCSALVGSVSIALFLRSDPVQQRNHPAPLHVRSEQPDSTTLEQHLLSLFSLEPSKKRHVPLVAAMIENHVDARPYQAGLPEALVVFEMIVEGDITRFLALFRSDKLPGRIGPIRSLRPHFVSAIEGYRPLLLHIGGSALAYETLETHPEIPHHDGIRYDGETYARDPAVPAPHNLYMGREKLLSLLSRMEASLHEVPLPLFNVGTSPTEGAETAETISVSFGDPLHDVTFTFDPTKHTYIHATGAAPSQASPANILLLEADVQGYGVRDAIPWTKTFGEGKLLLFREGKKIEGAWARKKGEEFSFLDSAQKPLTFSQDQVWIMLLPSLTMVY